MTLRLIAAVDAVLDEYRSYLQTELRASDEKLRPAFEPALAEPRLLVQEPFFQAHRLGWRVVELRAEDLARSAGLVSEIRAAAGAG